MKHLPSKTFESPALKMKEFHTVDGSLVKYRDIGEGKPIVFIHGWGIDFHLWHNKVEAIDGDWKSRHRRIYFDLPGMGRSIASAKVRNSDDVLRNIEELLAHLIKYENYLLAGASYGGYLARGLLLRKKARIDGLFLLCPLVIPGWRKGNTSPKVVLERDEKFLSELSQIDRKEFEYLSVIQTKDMWIDYKKDIHLDRLQENSGFLENRLDGSFVEDINAKKIEYRKPALILLGRQDTEVGFEDQYDLYKDFQRASILILDKAGHNLQIERQGIFRIAFLDWIERCESTEEDR